MRFLAFSDLHGDEAALESLAAIAPSFDHVLICGDISHTAVFTEDVLKAFPNSFVIPGNWDNKPVNDILFQSPQCIQEKRKEIGHGLNVVGFGYSCKTPFFTYGELTEEEIGSRMSELRIDHSTILLLHSPPFGHFDRTFRGARVGSRSILKTIEEKKPLAALFGHVHEEMGVDKLGPTTLIKLPPANSMRACALSVDDKNISVEFISL